MMVVFVVVERKGHGYFILLFCFILHIKRGDLREFLQLVWNERNIPAEIGHIFGGSQVVPVRGSWAIGHSIPSPLRFTCLSVWFFQRTEGQERHRSLEGRMHERLPGPGTVRSKGLGSAGWRSWGGKPELTFPLALHTVPSHCFRNWLCSNHVDRMLEVFPQPCVEGLKLGRFWKNFCLVQEDLSLFVVLTFTPQ